MQQLRLPVASFLIALACTGWAVDGTGTEEGVAGPSVSMYLTAYSITQKSLELSYDIKNDLSQDVWICTYRPDEPNLPRGWPKISTEKVYTGGASFAGGGPNDPEVFLDKDGRTVVIRRCIATPGEEFSRRFREYKRERSWMAFKRLRAGEVRRESLSFGLPVCPRWVFLDPHEACSEGTGWARTCRVVAGSVVVQIGYFTRLPTGFNGDQKVESGENCDYIPIPHPAGAEDERLVCMKIDGIVRVPYDSTYERIQELGRRRTRGVRL